MNIFVLDKDPKKAATQQIDKHIVKMPLESAQMLCAALVRHGREDTPYKATHKNHPCTLWTGKSQGNFRWLVKHGIALCEEYTSRYGKRHKCQDVIEWCAENDSSIPPGKQTDFAQAMPVHYKRICPVLAYRSYYKGDKARIANWKQNKPSWY
jgi:hypothetical protein